MDFWASGQAPASDLQLKPGFDFEFGAPEQPAPEKQQQPLQFDFGAPDTTASHQAPIQTANNDFGLDQFSSAAPSKAA
jgi:hypothetical protein